MSGDYDDEFNWRVENSDVVVPDQRATAVYVNGWGQAVIRQERAWDEERDTFVVIDHAHLPTLIAALMKIADVAPVRDDSPGTVVPDEAGPVGP
ncbi:hypothetical protein CK489_15325 [Bradyrhizobium sp. UFLA03-84]|uniref:hypothetical protein n=1 Tax=Bradyrhizobium sp. UFLA03-84 TaxID=418599 RepID=UPI000BAE673F|nr:hypothetical protein [Bradyrhizobium sp. UFLA03-84]PAY07169.1 hypothetical protein CK489_15325 [Bradyrhizobium sp. UFLA03-84]